MGKWSGLLVLALLLVTGAVYWMPAQASEAKPVASKLLQTLEDSGATGVSIQVRARVALGEVQRQEEVTELAKMWAKQLEIPLSLIEESRNHDVLMYRTTYKQNGVSVRYEMTSVPENGSFDTYLVLQLSGSRESLLYIEQIQETFAKALKNADFIPQISTCIRGLYNVKMSVDQQGVKLCRFLLPSRQQNWNVYKMRRSSVFLDIPLCGNHSLR